MYRKSTPTHNNYCLFGGFISCIIAALYYALNYFEINII